MHACYLDPSSWLYIINLNCLVMEPAEWLIGVCVVCHLFALMIFIGLVAFKKI